MATRSFFPADMALRAMGNTSKRYERHLGQGLVRGVALGEVRTRGVGRGQSRLYTVAAVIEGALALRLIDCGQSVERAYSLAAAFAYGQARGGQGLLFPTGTTWLVVAAEMEPSARGSIVLSDADPAFRELGEVARSVGRAGDGSGRILVNLSDLVSRVTSALNASGPFGGAGGDHD